ncbi:hypothetical protein GGX14DRAFT_570353 [Mycena pura]|uniref:Uncharacterized protein n=1 Tax=Mycena pura TaxID=153505 RepID=A0AAD6Y5X0_9AGAR|nr:hypothetical protein GGX14DRAFT_570353 [Mycena pura]
MSFLVILFSCPPDYPELAQMLPTNNIDHSAPQFDGSYAIIVVPRRPAALVVRCIVPLVVHNTHSSPSTPSHTFLEPWVWLSPLAQSHTHLAYHRQHLFSGVKTSKRIFGLTCFLKSEFPGQLCRPCHPVSCYPLPVHTAHRHLLPAARCPPPAAHHPPPARSTPGVFRKSVRDMTRQVTCHAQSASILRLTTAHLSVLLPAARRPTPAAYCPPPVAQTSALCPPHTAARCSLFAALPPAYTLHRFLKPAIIYHQCHDDHRRRQMVYLWTWDTTPLHPAKAPPSLPQSHTPSQADVGTPSTQSQQLDDFAAYSNGEHSHQLTPAEDIPWPATFGSHGQSASGRHIRRPSSRGVRSSQRSPERRHSRASASLPSTGSASVTGRGVERAQDIFAALVRPAAQRRASDVEMNPARRRDLESGEASCADSPSFLVPTRSDPREKVVLIRDVLATNTSAITNGAAVPPLPLPRPPLRPLPPPRRRSGPRCKHPSRARESTDSPPTASTAAGTTIAKPKRRATRHANTVERAHREYRRRACAPRDAKPSGSATAPLAALRRLKARPQFVATAQAARRYRVLAARTLRALDREAEAVSISFLPPLPLLVRLISLNLTFIRCRSHLGCTLQQLWAESFRMQCLRNAAKEEFDLMPTLAQQDSSTTSHFRS